MWVVTQNFVDFKGGKSYKVGDLIREEDVAKSFPDWVKPAHTEKEAKKIAANTDKNVSSKTDKE